MKIIKIIGCLSVLIFMVACNNVEIPEINPQSDLYADFELGVNFTDHMLALIYGDETYLESLEDHKGIEVSSDLYEMMYTHRVDYLLPQIFYYIPMSHDFKTKDQWRVYFSQWEKTLKENDSQYIKDYISGTSIEEYVLSELANDAKNEVFNNSMVVLLKAKSLYLKEFDYYSDKIWPNVSQVLYRKASYTNEMVRALDLENRWVTATQLEMIHKELRVSLTYYNHPELNNISIRDDKVVMYYDGQRDVSDTVSDISFYYGKKHLLDNNHEMIERMHEQYYVLSQEYDIYQLFSDLVDGAVSDYNNEVVDISEEQGIKPNVNLTFNRSHYNGSTYLESHMDQHLSDLLFHMPYMKFGKLHFLDTIYQEKIINDTVSIYYKMYYPALIRNKDGLFKIMSHSEIEDVYTMDSMPEVSSDGNRLLIISPFGWELIGELYIYTVSSQEIRKIVPLSYYEQASVKLVKWLDDDRILFIKGPAYGTVTRGGDLFLYDLRDDSLETVISFEDSNKEISDIYYDGAWYYTLITHNESFESYTEENFKLDIK